MRKTIQTLSTLAIAAALAMTTMTACSSDKETVENPAQPTQPTQPATSGVKVTVGAGMATDGAQTRSAVAKDGSDRVLKFTAGDKLYVYGALNDARIAGELTMVANSLTDDGLGAQFTGTIKAYDLSSGVELTNYSWDEDPLSGTTATLIHNAVNSNAISYTVGSPVTVNYNMYASDVETLMTSCLKIQGDYANGTGYTLSSSDPILNCTISGLTASTAYTFTLKKGNTSANNVSITTGADGVASFAFASMDSGNATWSIETKQGNTKVGTISLGNQNFTAKVYNISRYWMGTAFIKSVSGNVSLASVNDNIVVLNGSTLSGTLGSNVKISIAEGATVTLYGITINGVNSESYKWAGITCLGDATIVLADGSTNTVSGFCGGYPGIQAGPEETTLTIKGTGSLEAIGIYHGASIGSTSKGTCGHISIEGGTITARRRKTSEVACGAGIGSGEYGTCGNITISGGNITASAEYGSPGIGSGSLGKCGNISITGGTIAATGGQFAAGIGSGHGSDYNQGVRNECGNISITGGTITATGGQNASGIGSGNTNSHCGAITIASAVISITAIKGADANNRNNSIGNGTDKTTCGTVTFGTQTMYSGSAWTTTPENGQTYGGLNFAVSTTTNADDTWTLTPSVL